MTSTNSKYAEIIGTAHIHPKDVEATSVAISRLVGYKLLSVGTVIAAQMDEVSQGDLYPFNITIDPPCEDKTALIVACDEIMTKLNLSSKLKILSPI
jgi:hypothetical protein